MSDTSNSKIQPATIRYIKLGRGNQWFESCRANQRIELGHPSIAHETAQAGDWDAVIRMYIDNEGRTLAKAKDFVREARDFYELGANCLWITFADGCLWWAFSERAVEWLGGDGETHGRRARPTIGPWRNTNISGQLLVQSELSTKLTQVAAYRQTLCSIKDEAYVVRKINGEVEPLIEKAQVAETQLIGVAREMIESLHWADFETLVDLIFSQSGWRRVSDVGGTLKDIDLDLEQPATGERAFVQVKSKADASVYRDYVERFRKNPTYQRMFFVCHSPNSEFQEEESESIRVWTGHRLAQMTVKAGLFDWVARRIS